MTTKVKATNNKRLTKSYHINVRCTEQQKIAIDKAANRDGMGSSTWLLALGLKASRDEERA